MVGALNTKASNWMCSAVSWELWKFCVFIYVAIQGLNCSEVGVCCSMQDLLVVACKLLAVARGSSSWTRDQTQVSCIGRVKC